MDSLLSPLQNVQNYWNTPKYVHFPIISVVNKQFGKYFWKKWNPVKSLFEQLRMPTMHIIQFVILCNIYKCKLVAHFK